MNLLHDYIADQLADHISRRRVVVWFDPRREFADFIGELERDDEGAVLLDEERAQIFTYAGSFYELRSKAEPVVEADTPESTLVYLPGVERDHAGSVLMELECAGDRWEPQLRRLARNAMRQRFTDGVIDELLNKENVTYHDLVEASAGEEGEAPSILKTVVGSGSSEAMLACWLLDETLDSAIEEKEAEAELHKLVRARLALAIDAETALGKTRSIVARYVLGTEFRDDLAGPEPRQLESVPTLGVDATRNVRTIASQMRASSPQAYVELADTVETELGLVSAAIEPLDLGAIDTFRFEERALLKRCYELIERGDYPAVEAVLQKRQGSFWLNVQLERQAQWELCRRMVELATAATHIESAIQGIGTNPDEWIERYADDWYVLDQAQRRLETLIPKLEEEPEQRALVEIRNRYESALTVLARGFVKALDASNWSIEKTLHQTDVFDDVVKPLPGRVAYFLVDAMRYEMGVELRKLLNGHGEVSLRPAVGVLPSITITGMAALMPGAASSYSVAEEGGKLGARIDSKFLSGIRDRQRHVEGRIASSADIKLGDILFTSQSRLERKLKDAETIIVRSQEIDAFGEGGFEARQIMSTVIDNISLAVRKLSSIGVERAVITADHGHLYSAEDRHESYRIDAPGGATVELHRRCWIGRGGSTPSACIRVPASKLGNDTDLDFVFPVGIGVFKSGGDLSFHHGGPTLQEMVIPVLTVHSTSSPPKLGVAQPALEVTGEPATVTNRIFSVQVSVASLFGAGSQVMPMLISEGRQVGSVGMVIGADRDDSTGAVTLPESGAATLGFVLEDESAEVLRIVVLDPTSDAELYRSASDIPIDLGVA